jgi:hypothetical protein
MPSIMIPRDSKKMVQWIQAGDAGGERKLTGKWNGGRLQAVLMSGFLDFVPRPQGSDALEAVSQMPQQDQYAAELNHAEEVDGTMFPAARQAAEVF